MATKARQPRPKQTISPQKQRRIQELAAQGHSRPVIAKLAGVGYGTVDKYVAVEATRSQPIQQFKDHLSDLLHESLLSTMHLQHKMLTSMENEDISSIPTAERNNWIRSLSTVTGILYDKTRLQDGKSTVNTSHRIVLNDAHKLRAQRTTSSVSTPNEQEPVGETPVAIRDNDGQDTAQVVDIVEDNSE